MIASLIAFSAQTMATQTIFELYENITPGAVQARPSNFAIFNGELFFEAANASDNDEPFRYDGTTLTQITNASPLPGDDSNLTSQFVFNGNLYAVMESNVGRELYQYNTGNQQYELHTNLNGAGDGYPIIAGDINGNVIIYNGHLLMHANQTGSDRRFYLLRSDNNQLQLLAGTTKIDPSNVALFGGELFYEADDGAGNDEPFRFNGTTESQVTNASPLVGDDSNLTSQFVFNGNLYAVMESNVGRELYQYNTGNQQYEIHTNLNGAGDGYPIMAGDINGDVIIYNGHLLMHANQTGSDRRFYLLRSDNNQLQLLAGTTRIDPSNVALFGGNLYYEADDGAGNDEPFRFNGTTETQITNNAAPVGDDSNLTSQFPYLGDLYAVMESNNGRELYKYNTGTNVYERMIDLNGAGDSYPIHATDINGTVIEYQNAMIFRASDTGTEGELYRLRAVAVPPEISINDVSITEGNAGTSNLNFTVTRTNNTSAVSVNYATANGTATAGSDYVANSGTLNFTNGGGLTQNISISINGDQLVELNESFVVNLSNPTNSATISDSQGTGTINNNDAASLSINDITVTEGNAGTSQMTFTVTLNQAVDAALSVNASTANGTATLANNDYVQVSGSTINFAGNAGETQTLSVTINGDTVVETNETLNVNLSGLSASGRNVSISDAQGLGSINNNDAASLSINDVSITEGNAGNSQMTFTVTLDQAVDTALSINASTADGSATLADNDYVQVSAAAINFAGNAGETQTISVDVIGDTAVENNETLTVNLSGLAANGRNVTVTDSQGQGTINNDDAASFSIADAVLVEGDAGTSSMMFTVTLSDNIGGAGSVDYATANSTANSGSDYTNASGTLNFTGTAGETQNISIDISGDELVELDEIFLINLSNPVGTNVVIGDGQANGSINNDDSASLSINDMTVTEGDVGTSQMTFTVSLDQAVDTAFTIDASTADGTATLADSDYVQLAGSTINFAGTLGETQTVNVVVNGDVVVENNETLAVNLSGLVANGRDITVSDSQGQGTINNNDSASLSINDVSVAEGNAGTSQLTFTVTLDQAVDTAITIDASTTDGSATLADNDYVQLAGSTINFAGTSGETQTVSIVINGDTVVETNETLGVNLSGLSANGRDVTVADSEGLGTINNDDSSSFSVADAMLVEGDNGTSSMVFTVTLSAAKSGSASVDYATSNGTALSGSDYTSASGTLNFVGTAGETQTVTIDISGDEVVELDESLLVDLSNPIGLNATIADGQAIGTISNDDSATITINDLSINEGNSGTTAFDFTLTLDNAVDTSLSVDATTNDGTATSGTDYISNNSTINFVGNSSESHEFSVSVNGDNMTEANEAFQVMLGNLSTNGRNVVLSNNSVTGNILNDDSSTLSINDLSLAEGQAGSSIATLTVTLNLAVKGGVDVDYTTLNGTAQAGSDYTATNGTLNFTGTAGETQTIDVTINGDNLVELDEILSVELSNVSEPDVTLGDSSGVISVTNDDQATLSINDMSVVEGNAGNSQIILTITSDQAVDAAFSVEANTTDNSATVSDNDYVANNSTLNFSGNAGETQQITVDVVGDLAPESDEEFYVELSSLSANGRNVSIGNSQGTVTILSDDPDLSASKVANFTVPLGQTDNISYQVVLTNNNVSADQVVFNDTPDALTTIVPGSVTTTQGTILVGNTQGDTTIAIDIGTVNSGDTVTIDYDVKVNNGVNSGSNIVNQGLFSGANFQDILTDDPNINGNNNPTVAGVTDAIMVPTLNEYMLILLLALVFTFGVKRARFQ